MTIPTNAPTGANVPALSVAWTSRQLNAPAGASRVTLLTAQVGRYTLEIHDAAGSNGCIHIVMWCVMDAGKRLAEGVADSPEAARMAAEQEFRRLSSAAVFLTGSTRLPNIETMTFADADAEVVALLAAANGKRGRGEDAEREADFNVVVACELRDSILSTPPRTLADALAMLNRLACEESGIPAGMIPRQDTAVVLLRDFLATLAPMG